MFQHYVNILNPPSPSPPFEPLPIKSDITDMIGVSEEYLYSQEITVVLGKFEDELLKV